MKKVIKGAAALFLILICFSFQQQEKKLTVTLTQSQWEMVINSLQQSNGPHLQVQQSLELIIKPLSAQLQDTTKKK